MYSLLSTLHQYFSKAEKMSMVPPLVPKVVLLMVTHHVAYFFR